VHNKWGRRYARLSEKHRQYFEAAARRVLDDGSAILDLTVATVDLRFRRRRFSIDRRLWLDAEWCIDGRVHTTSLNLSGHKRNDQLVSTIASTLIGHAANIPGARPPERSASSERGLDPEGDDEAALVSDLLVLGEPAILELERFLRADPSVREAGLRALVARPDLSDLATLLAMAQTNEVVRLRLLRAIRDAKRNAEGVR
jgi:hypothetical protein